MSTVPKADTPPPANNAQTYTISGSEGMYGRPTNGGAPVPGKSEGNPPTEAPAGVIPANPIMGAIDNYPPMGSLSQAYDSTAYLEANAGASPSTGDTQAGADMGHGATQVVAEPDATGAPKSAVNSGTV